MGKSISTINLGSSEYGALSYSQMTDIATKGNMYEKKALNIVDDKKRIHDETITNSKINQQIKSAALNKPVENTKTTSQLVMKMFYQMISNALTENPSSNVFVRKNGEQVTNELQFIPVTMASSHATGNQSVKKPLSKHKKRKEVEEDNEYFINENKEANLLIFWELEKTFSN